MKKLIPILLLCFLVPSCEKGETKWFCWECNSMIYGKPCNDIFCHEDPTEIERYKQRLIDFYEGGLTNIECELLPDTISN
jgi:hypothetical protein